MRISTITNWAYGVTVLLTGLSGAAFLISARAADHERASVQQHLAFNALADDLDMGVDTLSDQARLYAVRRQARHLDAYRREALVERTRDHALARVRTMGAAPAELAAVAVAEANVADLDRIEQAGVAMTQAGHADEAEALLFGPEHERVQSVVLSALGNFEALTNARTRAEMLQAQHEADAANLVAKIMLTLTALVFLSVLYFVLRRRVAVPLAKMTGIVLRLARQDYAVEVPNDRRRDEIGDITQAIAVFKENGLARDRLEAERQADQEAKDSILQMMHRLQACGTVEELTEVVACFAPQTFPDLAGRLYVLDPGRNALQLAGSWQDPVHSAESFAPTACWGLRRGRPHVSNGAHQDVSCPHISDGEVKSICVPLNAQGDTIGLLYFEERPDVVQPREAPRLFLELMSDNVALTLANLRLRERLANLAVRDALTGLLNRRSLDSALNEHVGQGAGQLACIMVDIDHFKRFNDTFGHDAGDAVMQHVAQIIQEVIGGAGHAYRFGGEEFTILLPRMDEAEVLARAEALRARIGEAALAHHGRLLDHISISAGVAVSPDDGPASTLVRRADAALLQAKALGRDRTVAASRTAAIGDAQSAA